MLSCLPTCAHVIMVLFHVRLRFGTNPTPQSASELAVAISTAKYGSEMSLPVSNVERCSLRAPPLLELTRPAFQVVVPCAVFGLCNGGITRFRVCRAS